MTKKNVIRSSKRVASEAGKVLASNNASKKSKSIAAATLSNRRKRS